MLNRLLIAAIVLLTANPLLASTVGICHVPYALCAASGTTPTGSTIVVNGTTLDVTSNILEINGFKFCAVKNAGRLTSPL